MSIEVTQRPRLIGVRYAQNAEAQDLEQYLGIGFQSPPGKVMLNLYNRIAILAQLMRFGIFMPALKLNIQLLRTKTLGLYVPDFNVYTTSTPDPFVGRHENMHAYIDEQNPLVREGSDSFLTSIPEVLRGRVPAETLDVEKTEVYRCFNEGFCQWASVYVGLRTGNVSEAEMATKYHNKLMVNKENGDRLTSNTSYAITKFAVVRQAIQGIRQEVRESEKVMASYGTTRRARNRVIREATRRYLRGVLPKHLAIDDASYFVGYYFSDLFTQEALRRGLGITDAINLVISNPPSRLSELRTPKDYLGRLLK